MRIDRALPLLFYLRAAPDFLAPPLPHSGILVNPSFHILPYKKGALTRMFVEFLSALFSHVLYLALHLETGSFPRPLSPARERQAFEDFHRGDPAAKDLLVRHNLRLVAHIAKKYYASAMDQDDLISIGTIGLIKAVESFDPSKQARFSTYASRCIENEIKMQFRRVRKEAATVSLQDSLESSRDGSALTVMDIIPDGFRMEEQLDLREDYTRLRQLLGCLGDRERKVLMLRYGLNGHPALTQQEVSEILGISRSYVSRLEKKALRRLRSAFER